MTARRAMDDPRLLLSFPFRALHFVFGLAGEGTQRLPGVALVAALQSIGMSPAAVRALLLRLRRAGAIVSRRDGRRATYELTPASRRLVDEIFRRVSEDPPAWDGVFRTLFVDAPAGGRAYREVLRRHAEYAGFGGLQPGVLISPTETSWAALEPTIAAAPRGFRLLRGELRLSDADARAVAREVWSVDTLATSLLVEVARMRAATAAQAVEPCSGAAALVRLWDAIGPFFLVFSGRPPLPPELLPESWPMADARGAFQEVAAALAPSARVYLDMPR